MQANTTSPRPRVSDVASWMVAITGLVLLVLLFLSFVLETRTPSGSSATTSNTSGGSIAFFEFGLTADTLWLASTADPSNREALFTAPHAAEFGVVPSVSANGNAIAYTALPTNTAAPAPDAPAALWYAPLSGGNPRHIASDVDLLVAPVWSPTGDHVVFRRSDATSYALLITPTSGGDDQRILVMTASDYALFPVGFTPDGETFYHVTVSNEGTRLFSVDVASGELTPVSELYDGLTRDWTLSPDGTELAFLGLAYGPQAITSRAYVMDLASAEIEPVTDARVMAFSPIWDQEGALVVGTLTPTGESGFIKVEDGQASQVLGAGSGFDVPLAYLPGGAYLVQAFDGESLKAPGHVSLTLIDSNGERHVLSRGEVTFAGWSAR